MLDLAITNLVDGRCVLVLDLAIANLVNNRGSGGSSGGWSERLMLDLSVANLVDDMCGGDGGGWRSERLVLDLAVTDLVDNCSGGCLVLNLAVTDLIHHRRRGCLMLNLAVANLVHDRCSGCGWRGQQHQGLFLDLAIANLVDGSLVGIWVHGIQTGNRDDLDAEFTGVVSGGAQEVAVWSQSGPWLRWNVGGERSGSQTQSGKREMHWTLVVIGCSSFSQPSATLYSFSVLAIVPLRSDLRVLIHDDRFDLRWLPAPMKEVSLVANARSGSCHDVRKGEPNDRCQMTCRM